MDALGKNLLAGTGFALNEDRAFIRRHFARQFDCRDERGRKADQVAQRVAHIALHVDRRL